MLVGQKTASSKRLLEAVWGLGFQGNADKVSLNELLSVLLGFLGAAPTKNILSGCAVFWFGPE